MCIAQRGLYHQGRPQSSVSSLWMLPLLTSPERDAPCVRTIQDDFYLKSFELNDL
jgi:hypothetical protein